MLGDRETFRDIFHLGFDALFKSILYAERIHQLSVFVADMCVSDEGVPFGKYPAIDDVVMELKESGRFTDEPWWGLLNGLFLGFTIELFNADELLELNQDWLGRACEDLLPTDDHFSFSYVGDALEALEAFRDKALRLAIGHDENGVEVLGILAGKYEADTLSLSEDNYQEICVSVCENVGHIDWQPVLDRLAWQRNEVLVDWDTLEDLSNQIPLSSVAFPMQASELDEILLISDTTRRNYAGKANIAKRERGKPRPYSREEVILICQVSIEHGPKEVQESARSLLKKLGVSDI